MCLVYTVTVQGDRLGAPEVHHCTGLGAPGVIWTLRRAAFEGVPDLQLFPQLLYSLPHNDRATS